MKINKIDLVGIAAGFMIALTSWIRYFTHPADFGETVLGGLIGIILIIQFWMHHNQTKIGITLYDVEEYLADLNREEENETD